MYAHMYKYAETPAQLETVTHFRAGSGLFKTAKASIAFTKLHYWMWRIIKRHELLDTVESITEQSVGMITHATESLLASMQHRVTSCFNATPSHFLLQCNTESLLASTQHRVTSCFNATLSHFLLQRNLLSITSFVRHTMCDWWIPLQATVTIKQEATCWCETVALQDKAEKGLGTTTEWCTYVCTYAVWS